MSNFKIYNKDSKPTEQEKEAIVQFLYTHLDEFGDDKDAILKREEFIEKIIESGAEEDE